MFAVFVRRLAGAAMLDPATYEEVEADRDATIQAVAVVVLASLAAAIGARGATSVGATLEFFVLGTIVSLAVWIAFATLTFQIGTRLLPQSETNADAGQLLRTLGFAAAPGLLQIFGVFSEFTIPIFVVALAWTLLASAVAVRQALDYATTRRAVAVCGLAWLGVLLVTAMFSAVVLSAAGCSFAMRPVEFNARATDWQALAGSWRGDYAIAGRARHGVVEFRLKALEREATGDVLMIPDRLGWPETGMPPKDGTPRVPSTASQLLAIRFVEADRGLIRGTMEPYWDPDRECRASATFVGSVDGDVVAGSFSSVCDDRTRILTGRWRVHRQRGR